VLVRSWSLTLSWVIDVHKCCVQVYLVVLSLPLLNEHDIFYRLNYIELVNVFPKLSGLYLSVVKKILNHVMQELG
jgi:hypothetical protein